MVAGRVIVWFSFCMTKSLPDVSPRRFWYSPQAMGYCPHAVTQAECTWRVVATDAIINKTCQDDRWDGWMSG